MTGRPSYGVRRQCNVRLPPDLIAAIDTARGTMSRDLWFERAARFALKPTSLVADPELKQDIVACTHPNLRPKRTEFRVEPGKEPRRVRISECLDCHEEVAL